MNGLLAGEMATVSLNMIAVEDRMVALAEACHRRLDGELDCDWSEPPEHGLRPLVPWEAMAAAIEARP